MAEKYIQLKISTDQQVNDLVVGFLSDVGAEGFVEESNELSCYFADRKWNPSFRTDVGEFLGNLKKQGKISSFAIEVSEDPQSGLEPAVGRYGGACRSNAERCDKAKLERIQWRCKNRNRDRSKDVVRYWSS